MLGPLNTTRRLSGMTSQQIQDGRQPPYWKSKICYNSAAADSIFTKFGVSMQN